MPAVIEAEETGVATGRTGFTPPHLAPYLFKPGQCGNPKGRPRGARATTVVERAETRIAKKYVQRALSDGAKDQGEMLRHAIDKFIPDAGAAGSTNILLMSAEDMSAIQALASSLLMAHSVGVSPQLAAPITDAEVVSHDGALMVQHGHSATVQTAAGTETEQVSAAHEVAGSMALGSPPPTPPLGTSLPSL